MNGSDDGIHTVDAIRAANAADTSRRDFGASGGVPGLLEAQSPPLHVVPLRNFEPDILEYAHRLEAELLVKSHIRVVRQGMPARALMNPWMRRIPSKDVLRALPTPFRYASGRTYTVASTDHW